MSRDELARIRAMQRWVDDTTATRVIPWKYGTAVFTDDFPGRYDANYLRVDEPVDGLEAVDLAAEADAVQAALRHRELQIEDDAAGERLAAGFVELGYDRDPMLWMVQHEPAPLGSVAVREVDAATLHPVIAESNRSFPGMSEDDAVMLADFRFASEERIGTRFFAAELDGEIAAFCEVYRRDDIAQVEDVNTLERFRRRGAGGSVVRAAAAAARAAGAELVWLFADPDDWPQHLYAGMGFEPIARSWVFTKAPPTAAAGLHGSDGSGA